MRLAMMQYRNPERRSPPDATKSGWPQKRPRRLVSSVLPPPIRQYPYPPHEYHVGCELGSEPPPGGATEALSLSQVDGCQHHANANLSHGAERQISWGVWRASGIVGQNDPKTLCF
jgi:hypothetical protein